VKNKIGFLDLFPISDGRPETTIDGRHYCPVLESEDKPFGSRPRAGEADQFFMDWEWDEWITGRSVDLD
jgi:hypothetical protein